MSRDSTKRALDNFFRAQAKETERASAPKKKRERPEMDLVQRPCKAWFRKNDWAMIILDAKAVWSDARQAYVPDEEIPTGFSDATGCTPNGISAFVEFKAPGKRATLKPHQRLFLVDKIKRGCFAVCVDSVDCLSDAWTTFQGIRAIDPKLAINFLMRHLPAERVQRERPCPSDDLPF